MTSNQSTSAGLLQSTSAGLLQSASAGLLQSASAGSRGAEAPGCGSIVLVVAADDRCHVVRGFIRRGHSMVVRIRVQLA